MNFSPIFPKPEFLLASITGNPKTDVTAILELVCPFWKLPNKVHTETPRE